MWSIKKWSEKRREKVMARLEAKRTYVQCEICGECFASFPSRVKKGNRFCSMSCRNKSYIGRKQSPELVAKRTIGMFKGGRKVSKKRWKDKNKEAVNFHTRSRRYRLRGAIGTHTLQEWDTLKKFYNYICLCCKRQEPFIKLTEDHVVPITMGGLNDISNIQPLCQECNSRKYTTVIDYRILTVSEI